jgi:hypothetical protein
MVPELLILSFALVLFFYWLRYNCHAIVETASADGRARQVASANNLSFPDVGEKSRAEPQPEDLAAMHRSLARDYRVLTALLAYTTAPAHRYTIEQRMLMLDFRVLSTWFVATHGLLYTFACRSLSERSRILHYFASLLGERCAVLTR